MTGTNIPAHVPEHLVRDFDYTAIRGDDDLFLDLRKLHDGPDFFWTPRHGGYWVATRHADMRAIIENVQDFSSRDGSGLPRNPYPLPLLESDAPLHGDYRALIAPFFTNKYVGELERNVRELTIALIEEFRPRGECEFVRDFAQKMPIIIVMSLLDLPPEDRPALMPIAEDMVRGDSPEAVASALGRLGAYVAGEVIPARRRKPGKDIFSALLEGSVAGGRPLSDHELVNLGSLLIAAGLDTVASMLGFVTMFLARHPGHRAQLLEKRVRLKHALEEMIRRHHITHPSRVAVRDMDYCGIALKAGDLVFLPLTLAGIDERRYPDALTVDFARADTKHLAFGRGPHQCIGAFLARTELRVFLEEWLARIPDFAIRAGERPKVLPGKVCSVRYLPLTWPVG